MTSALQCLSSTLPSPFPMTVEIRDRAPLIACSHRADVAHDRDLRREHAILQSLLSILLVAVPACGRHSFDQTTEDARADVDGNADDAARASDAPLASACLGPGPGTVALYELEAGALARDTTGQQHGMVRGTVTSVTGPCGMAARFTTSSYVLVPPSPAFELATGSIELHARIASVTGTTIRGLFGRDAENAANPGHILAGLAEDGTIVARIQSTSGNYYRCAPPPQANAWFHVGISFGGTPAQGFRMWVDGVAATVADTINFGESSATCNSDYAAGIAGNQNALVIAANNGRAPEGSPDPATQHHFVDGDIDHVHVRDTWIDFAAR
jgi:hypothetical protein